MTTKQTEATIDLLMRLEEYFDLTADVDDGLPNESMTFMAEIQAARYALEGDIPKRVSGPKPKPFLRRVANRWGDDH